MTTLEALAISLVGALVLAAIIWFRALAAVGAAFAGAIVGLVLLWPREEYILDFCRGGDGCGSFIRLAVGPTLRTSTHGVLLVLVPALGAALGLGAWAALRAFRSRSSRAHAPLAG